MKYYKFLQEDNCAPYSDFDYTEYLPNGGDPGPWLPRIDTVEICKSGYHATNDTHLLEWANA